MQNPFQLNEKIFNFCLFLYAHRYKYNNVLSSFIFSKEVHISFTFYTADYKHVNCSVVVVAYIEKGKSEETEVRQVISKIISHNNKALWKKIRRIISIVRYRLLKWPLILI